MLRISDTTPGAAPLPSVLFGAPQCNLDKMMDSYGNALLRLCYMYLKDMHLAEDAVQETFLKVYNNYHRFDQSGSEKAWVTRIAVNVCKDVLRSAWRRRVNVREELADIAGSSEDGYAGADTTLVEEVMRLKPKYREVILLFYYQDMKIADIAAILDTPESTISVRLKRARDTLKERLGGWYYGEA